MLSEQKISSGTLVIAVYSHIEAYPPSLNALYHLAAKFEKVIVLVPNVMQSKWKYPGNVELKAFGEYTEVSLVGKKPFYKKIAYFIGYGKYLSKLIRQSKPKLILVYDPLSFSALNLFSTRIIKKIGIPIWYHNHDVMNTQELPKFSLMWLSRKLELKYFSRLTLFSIPNKIRLQYFPVNQLRYPPIILPNYPSTKIFAKHYIAKNDSGDAWRLIFQGHISSNSMLEQFVKILSTKIVGRKLELHLAGPIDLAYKGTLLSIARNRGVENQLIFYGLLPYGELPLLTASCHIGIAVYGMHNTMVKTMSTASNKIFEYASLGLPVIINKRSDMEDEFSSYSWICFTDLQEQSLLGCLNDVAQQYLQLSEKARRDFEENLNFEIAFEPLLQNISSYLHK